MGTKLENIKIQFPNFIIKTKIMLLSIKETQFYKCDFSIKM